MTPSPPGPGYGSAGFNGSGSIASRGVPVKQMLTEASSFPGVWCWCTSSVPAGSALPAPTWWQVAAPGAQRVDAVPDQA
ncbi:hypothetical protein HaLaN_08045, partial [Haematococcus lacustris]